MLLSIVLTAIFTGLIMYLVLDSQHSKELLDLGEQFEEREKEIRKEAIESSKRVTRGQVSEQMLPLFPDFPYNMSDCKFFSAPIDYIVFDGMSDARNKDSGEISIVFADVKTGSAKKTFIQKKIKEAVENGRVRFEEWRVDKDNRIIVK